MDKKAEYSDYHNLFFNKLRFNFYRTSYVFVSYFKRFDFLYSDFNAKLSNDLRNCNYFI